jgi:hypothetical protein
MKYFGDIKNLTSKEVVELLSLAVENSEESAESEGIIFLIKEKEKRYEKLIKKYKGQKD